MPTATRRSTGLPNRTGQPPTLKELAGHFGKSDPTTRKALDYATEHGVFE